MWKRVMTRGRRCVVKGSREAEVVTAGSADVAATWVVVEPDVAAGVVLLVVAAVAAVRSVAALPAAAAAVPPELPVAAQAALAAPAGLAASAVDLRWAVA